MTLAAILARHPRPWRADGAVVLDRDGDIVHSFDDGDTDLARLLAAAPGAVEALEKIEAWPALSMLPPLATVEAMKELARAALAALKEENRG